MNRDLAETLANGWERDECAACHGTGLDDTDRTCPRCRGEGVIWEWDEGIADGLA